MTMTITVRDVMTWDVATARETESFKEVAKRLAAYRVGALPVIDGDRRVVGVVSETDLLLKHEPDQRRPWFRRRGRVDRRRAGGRLAGTIMSYPAVTVRPEATVAAAARLMHARNVRHLPVVDVDRQLVGIVSRGDLLRAFLRPDEDLRREVRTITRSSMPDADLSDVAIRVADGVVGLSGRVQRRSMAVTLAARAAEVDGVVGVDNYLACAIDDDRVPPPL
jgi:CBS-domain-containing membrane protein